MIISLLTFVASDVILTDPSIFDAIVVLEIHFFSWFSGCHFIYVISDLIIWLIVFSTLSFRWYVKAQCLACCLMCKLFFLTV